MMDSPIVPSVRARECRPNAGAATLVVLAGGSILGGCALTEVTVTESEDVVIAEAQLTINLHGDGSTSLDVYTYLHRTLSGQRADEVEGAAIRVSGTSAVVHLAAADSGGVCLDPWEDEEDEEVLEVDVGSCYRASVAPSPFSPGEVLELEVVLPEGGTLTGVSQVPDAFEFIGLTHEDGHCRIEPDTNYRFRWTEAAGTWSYISDTWIEGLPEALAGRDIEVPDSLYLTGFAIGEKDTDVLFPGEYGLFDLGEQADADLLRILDDGLPGGAWGEVAFAATDRNWVNWARGGNFNPSGLIRIPSVFGDGTGFFGTATQRQLNVIAGPDGSGMPPLCGPADPAS
ncbi:MAG: hypothetical protein OXU75_22345 [Deltaproteobacteria bacterium]|nr:hypothetical protein [Deltaproteobacteria bacterium]MDE0035856.1 hypothetical protein [Deltaproteobacteria bacterium]